MKNINWAKVIKLGIGWALLFCGLAYLVILPSTFGTMSEIPLPIMLQVMSMLITGGILVK